MGLPPLLLPLLPLPSQGDLRVAVAPAPPQPASIGSFRAKSRLIRLFGASGVL